VANALSFRCLALLSIVSLIMMFYKVVSARHVINVELIWQDK
jgi:hypothetical protein